MMQRKIQPKLVRILHIEDDPFDIFWFRSAVLNQYPMENFEIIHAQSLHDALKMRRDMVFNLIVADLNLPDGTDQGDTIERIASHFPSVPILVLTGSEDTQAVVYSFRNGARDYYIKRGPRIQDLIQTVKDVIDIQNPMPVNLG